MVTPGDFAQTDDDDDDTDEKQDTPAVTKKRSGHNTSNAAKHSKLIGEISELMEKHYVFNEHEGDPYALCPICNGAFGLGRITAGKDKAAASKCTLIARPGNLHGADIKCTKQRPASSLKRTLKAHLTSGIHRFCAGLSTAHRRHKRALEKALTTSEELLARLFRTDSFGAGSKATTWARPQSGARGPRARS